MLSTTLLTLLLPLVSAHFQLLYPAARGFDEDLLVNYPCGGQNTVSSNRTLWPDTGAPIQLNMGHTSARVQVLIAYGNNPTGDDFTTVLMPTVQETGPRSFCMGDVMVPQNSMTAAGMNATIMVVTNGDPSGGLYNCADITFTSTPLTTAQFNTNCVNSTGVSASPVANAATINANGTTVGSAGAVSGVSSSTAAPSATGSSSMSMGATSATGAAASSTAKPNGAAATAGAQQVVGAAVVGLAGLAAVFM